VSLYLGAWILAVGAALVAFFPYRSLRGAPEVAAVWAAAAPTAWIGVLTWRRGNYRVAIAYLLAFCLLAPVAVLVTFEELRLFIGVTHGHTGLELFYRLGAARRPPMTQLWWSLAAGLPVCWACGGSLARRCSQLMFAAHGRAAVPGDAAAHGNAGLSGPPIRAVSSSACFPARCCSWLWDTFSSASRQPDDSRYFYPFGVAFTWTALSGLAAFHKPYADWIQRLAPWTRGQEEYLFLIKRRRLLRARPPGRPFQSEQVRMVGRSFRS